MYAASVEGLSPEQRAAFNEALLPPRPVLVRALPAAPERRALRAVPALSPDRISAERLAAIRRLGGDVSMNEGA